MASFAFHSVDAEDALRQLESKKDGLDEHEVASRVERYGPNILMEKKKTTALEILLDQFKDFLIILLIAAALVSIVIGVHEDSMQEMVEAGLIITIVVFIVIVGFYQQYHAEKELEALKNMMSPSATVVRGGKKQKIDAKDLVPGDIIYLEAGDRVPADLRVTESTQLRADESSLTGESNPVDKNQNPVNEDSALGDRTCMLYMATTVVYGRGYGVVTSTGMETEIGKIAGNISEIKEEKTPLQIRLNTLGKQIGVGVVLLCIFIFLTGVIFQGTPYLEMFMVAIALAVAAVPEGLPGVVTVALANGTRKMVSEDAIIRKLPAVETLGSTTVICSDKTGTLTKNQMTVKKLWVGGDNFDVLGDGYLPEGGFKKDSEDIKRIDDNIRKPLLAGLLSCEATVDEAGKITGDPTEAAIVVAAYKAGLNDSKLLSTYKRAADVPFSSERKRKTIIYRKGGEVFAAGIGAPDVILKDCVGYFSKDGVKKLNKQMREAILSANEGYARDAYRVIGLCYKDMQKVDEKACETDMVFAGLVAMIDPPREDSKVAIEKCKSAGIRVMMITGDHAVTAKAIGQQLGLCRPDDDVLTGPELEKMSDDELTSAVGRVSIYARVSPVHKLRIVTALQKKEMVCAMTGDGVNDAPALKKADIGIAMGITGTDVSKEAADMVLTDDNFSTIVTAVEQGRGIYDNIRKFFAYLISGNIGEVAVVFLSSIIPGVPIALTASQILIINLVTDGLPALALGVDPFEPGAMQRKPRPKTEPLHHGLSSFILWYPLLMIAVTMGMFLYVFDPVKQNIYEAQTVAFLCIAFFEMYQAFASRSTRFPALKVGLFKNKYLLMSVGLSLAVILTLLYIPVGIPGTGITLQELTHTVYLNPLLFIAIVVFSSVGFIYLEISKWRSTRGLAVA